MDPKHTQEMKVREGLARQLFDNAGLALATNLVNGALWVLAIWSSLDHRLALAWYACLGLVTLLRWRTVLAFRRGKQAGKASERLVDHYTLGALAAGMIWAAAGIILIRSNDPALQALAGFLLGGMAAGAAVTSASNPLTYFAFSLTMMVPIVPLLVLEGGTMQLVMAVMGSTFILVLSKTVRQAHAVLRRSLTLGHENAGLVQELERELDERERAQAAKTQSEARFRALAESTGTAIFTYRDHFLYVNPAGEHLCGYSAEELTGMPFSAIVHPDHRDLVKSNSESRLNDGAIPRHYELKILTKGGETRWVSFSTCVIDQDGQSTGLGSAFDITAHKAATEALFVEKEMAQVTLKSLGDGVITTDLEGRILSLNHAAETLTGWTETEALGHRFGVVFRLSANDRKSSCFDDPILLCISEGESVTYGTHLQLLGKEGADAYSVDLSTSPIRDRAGTIIGAVAVFHDVSDLSYAASHDALTGLINGREFLARLEHAVVRARVDLAEHALCYIDLDQFKVVNDTCGHAAGDKLLKELTALLQTQTREGDTLARLGGDEFGLLLPYCPLDKAAVIAESMRKLAKDFRFNWSGRSFEIGASIGVVHIDKDSGDATELLRAADSACYVAKAHGRNRVHLYEPDDLAVAEHQQHIAWVSRIQQGLDRDEFELHFQTIQPLDRQGGEHFELLLRLRDDQGKLISPGEFIPTAERYDLMPALDRWVIHTALARLAPLLREDTSRMCAINLSGQSLGDERMVEFILKEIAAQNIPPATLCFEITETSAISHLGHARDLAFRLKAAGCFLALDDFGSGLSSFSYLKELPVDFLKIDGAFVKNIERDPIDRAIVSSIVQVARAMGKKTVAEYVEDASCLDWMRSLGVDYAQGYYIARPRPLEEFGAPSRRDGGAVLLHLHEPGQTPQPRHRKAG
ncbi:MAG TPA: EAL domain-containing protein [Thiobacillaceae bacterium]|nr:EAL domain-containing protein [Thiobacillaceae bacterium]